jgi:hypothetical protein
VLFASDGFSYCHFHGEDQCGCLAEEVEEVDLPDQTAIFAMAAFYWTQFADVAPYIKRLEELVFDDLEVELIAPTHGLPFADLRTTMPLVTEGLRAGSRIVAGGSLVDET